MNVIVGVIAAVAILVAIAKAQFPNIERIANELKDDWSMATRAGKVQRQDAKDLASKYRSKINRKVLRTFYYILVCLLIVVASVTLFAILLENSGNTATDISLYFTNKLRYVLRLDELDGDVIAGQLWSSSDKLVSWALIAALGAVLVNLLRLVFSFACCTFFPVRWWKWSRLDYYFSSDEREREKRRVLLLMNSDTPISPSGSIKIPHWLPPIWRLYTRAR